MLNEDKNKMARLESASTVDQKMMTTRSTVKRKWLGLRRQFQSYYFITPPFWRVLVRAMQSKERMVPDFASLGATRSGTSSLSDYIMQHPCVVLPLAKEIGVQRAPMMKYLMAQFPSLDEKQKVEKQYGKAITGYCTPVLPSLSFPFMAKAVSKKAKGVVILRDPVERTFAHWRWDQALLRRVQGDPLWQYFPDFPDIINMELEAIEGGYGPVGFSQSGGRSFIQSSLYLPFIKNLLKVYERENIMFVNSTDFFSDPIATVKEVFQFLELPEFEPQLQPVRNAGPKYTMDEQTEQRLKTFFKPYNEALFELIGEDFGWE